MQYVQKGVSEWTLHFKDNKSLILNTIMSENIIINADNKAFVKLQVAITPSDLEQFIKEELICLERNMEIIEFEDTTVVKHSDMKQIFKDMRVSKVATSASKAEVSVFRILFESK